MPRPFPPASLPPQRTYLLKYTAYSCYFHLSCLDFFLVVFVVPLLLFLLLLIFHFPWQCEAAAIAFYFRIRVSPSVCVCVCVCLSVCVRVYVSVEECSGIENGCVAAARNGVVYFNIAYFWAFYYIKL